MSQFNTPLPQLPTNTLIQMCNDIIREIDIRRSNSESHISAADSNSDDLLKFNLSLKRRYSRFGSGYSNIFQLLGARNCEYTCKPSESILEVNDPLLISKLHMSLDDIIKIEGSDIAGPDDDSDFYEGGFIDDCEACYYCPKPVRTPEEDLEMLERLNKELDLMSLAKEDARTFK